MRDTSQLIFQEVPIQVIQPSTSNDIGVTQPVVEENDDFLANFDIIEQKSVFWRKMEKVKFSIDYHQRSKSFGEATVGFLQNVAMAQRISVHETLEQLHQSVCVKDDGRSNLFVPATPNDLVSTVENKKCREFMSVLCDSESAIPIIVIATPNVPKSSGLVIVVWSQSNMPTLRSLALFMVAG